LQGYTKKYRMTKLVYYEVGGDIHTAILREKQLKGWTRIKKFKLIESCNPNWEDLYEKWLKA
jgi:putative endonuclease